MIREGAVLIAATLAIAGGAAPAQARTRAAIAEAHCEADKEASPPGHLMKCSIDGPGKFDIGAEATFTHGGPMGWAQLSVALDGRACGHEEAANFSGRGQVYGGCERRKLGPGPHDVVITLDYRDATHDDTHVNVVRRP